MAVMEYFADESRVATLACGVVIENRCDRVRVGESDITRDRLGLKLARALLASTHQQEVREVLSALLNVLEGDERAGRLEDRVMTKPPTVGDSVFGLTKPGFLR